MASGKDYSIGYKFKGDASGFQRAVGDMERSLNSIKKNTSIITLNQGLELVKKAVDAAKMAFEIYGNVMNTTNATGDKFEIQTNKIKFTLDEVKRSIATVNFEGLSDRIRDAARAGEALAKQLDLVFDLSLRLKLIESNIELDMARQELLFRNKTLAIEDRIVALNKFISLNQQLETEQLKFAQAEVKSALAASSVAASKLPEERLKYYVQNADLLAENEDAVKAYLKAQKDLDEELARPLVSTGYRQLDIVQNPENIRKLREQIAGASSVVKDFASDYQNWMLIIDPERSGLTNAWSKLDNVMKQATINALKTIRYGSSLLEVDEVNAEKLVKTLIQIDKLSVGKSGVIAALVGEETGKAKLAPDMVSELTEGLGVVQTAVDSLSTSFEEMFLNIGGGFKGMIESMLSSLQLLIAKLIGKAALFGILQLLFPGSGLAVRALTGLRSFIGTPGYAEGTNFAPGGISLVGERGPELVNLPRGSQVIPGNRMGAFNERLVAKLRGRDIDIVLERYQEQKYNST
jgi:hypothetical protein